MAVATFSGYFVFYGGKSGNITRIIKLLVKKRKLTVRGL